MHATTGRVILVGLVLAGCGGGGAESQSASSSGTPVAPQTTVSTPETTAVAVTVTTVASTAAAQDVEVSLDGSSLCEDWLAADGSSQRSFAEELGAGAVAADAVLAVLAAACTDAAKGRLISDVYNEAVAQVVAAQEAASGDPYAATRINGKYAREVANSVRKSWNECGDGDVCIAGTTALSVGCSQPDPQVRKLRCFVVTEKKGDSSYGFPVAVNVDGDGSYSWGLAEND